MKPRNVTPKPHTAGIVAALVTTLGVVLETLRDAQVLPLLPHWLSIAVTVAGIVLQSLTKGVQHGGTVIVDRDVAEVKGIVRPKENP